MMSLSHIRSFVVRSSRPTAAQQRALTDLWPFYGVSVEDKAFWLSIKRPCVLEIGFGMGASLVTMAQRFPQVYFIGVEVYPAGIGACLQALHASHINNVRIVQADVWEVLLQGVPDNLLRRIQIFFPDPWPKKRHHKRRLISRDFVRLMVQKLALGGYIHMATDSSDYAQSAKAIFEEHPHLLPAFPEGVCIPRQAYRPMTKYEARAERLGHVVQDLLYYKS